MNARISRNFTIESGIHYEGKYIVNSYMLEVFMTVNTEDTREQNIALDRIKYLVEEVFDSCVFVDQQDLAAIDNYMKANMKVCPVPEGPYDQVIGLLLMSKFNTVAEDRLLIYEIKISSRVCDDLNFYVEVDEELPIVLAGNWWHENNTSICDIKQKVNKKDKVLQLKREVVDWADLDLVWTPKPKIKSKVVYIAHENLPQSD